ncbi:MAG: tetratricopeptide repeat protein [Magnetococcales bacterium]|nr:tetratricopeptide repeat protein [Magnetococcales bacterium]
MSRNRMVPQRPVRQSSVQQPSVRQRAFNLYAEGKMAQSLAAAEQVMAISPQDIHMLNLAAACHMGLGNAEQALFCWQQALRIRPDYVEACTNMSVLLQALNRFEEAEVVCRQALHIHPDHAEAHYNLGNLLKALHHFAEAEVAYRRALHNQADHAAAYANLGVLLQDQHRFAEAEAAYGQALRIQPDYADAHYNLGNLLKQQNRPTEAEAAYRWALRSKPAHAEALNNLGVLLQESKQVEAAEATYRNALHIKPDYADAHNNLGHLLKEMHRFAEAEAAYCQALRLQPDHAEAHSNWGVFLQERQRLAEAEMAYRHALRIQPNHAETHFNLGVLLQELQRSEEAEVAYREAIRLKPDYAEAYNNLGNLLRDSGHLDEAETSYRQAMTRDADYTDAYSGLLFTQNYRSNPMREEMLADARRFGQQVAAKAQPMQHKVNPADIDRRLRIGLVSGDLRNHSVGYFLEGVLAALDPALLELFAYATSTLEDALTQKFRAIIPHWRTVQALSDADLARLIRSDAIDILLDLSGHTTHNRLSMFAWKPAPVQISWLGYCATTGVAAMDYFLGDAITLPGGDNNQFVEKPWCLPDCYLCFTPPDLAIPLAPLPACTQGVVTFGCFNNLAKVTDAVVACWAQILMAVPDSRLFCKNAMLGDPAMQRRILERFQHADIAPDRLLLAGYQTRQDHFKSYQRVDIALDPFPYPGVTTSVEALWMGVPVLTKKGDCFLARQGETLLSAAGLPDWIACDTDDYVAKAIGFANDLPRLATVRAGLRQQVLDSPLFDAPRLANSLTQAWQEMWRIWCHASTMEPVC